MVSTTSVFIETPSLERLPPKAEEFFLPMRKNIPRRTPTRYIKVLGILLLLLLLLLTLYFSLTNLQSISTSINLNRLI